MKLSQTLIALAALAFPLAAMAQNTFPATGNVGIGNPAPLHNLHIEAQDNPYLLIRARTYSNSPTVFTRKGGIIFNQENTDKTAGIQFAVPPGFHVPGILFSTKTSYNVPGAGMTDWYDRMFIHPKGNIGIGTVAPASTFNANQAAYPSYGADDRVLTIHSETNASVLELSRAAGSASGARVGALFFTNTTNSTDAHLQVAGLWAENAYSPANPQLSGGRLVFMAKATNAGVQSKMIFDEKGNLNLGLSTPNTQNHRLAVEGTIGARQVKVSQETWADFVFHPGYQLPSLHDLETFILQHKHLPDIPPEEEVRRDGVDLGEMNKKLLQKVEELTLHIIELNKRLEALEKSNEEEAR